MDQPESILQFQEFSSAVDVTFWYELAKRKLEVLKLDEHAVPIHGTYSPAEKIGSLLCLSHESFNPPIISERTYVAPGNLFISNTKETFKTTLSTAFLKQTADQIEADIESGAAANDALLLTRFAVTCHADLKNYIFYSMFAFPALTFPGDAQPTARPPISLNDPSSAFHGDAANQLVSNYQQSRDKLGGFFIVRNVDGKGIVLEPLSQLNNIDATKEEVTVGFVDPCILPKHPGWPLRNLLFLLAKKWKIRKVSIISFRGSADKSLVFRVSLPELAAGNKGVAVGWEKNNEGKAVPRVANLQLAMDPIKLATRSAELNLQLMKWRLLPNLELSRLGEAKCLLIGAGTLGCNIARTLVAWGIRNVTFVDNGKVSYSNPVRQSLFTFADSVDGGKPKAACAAERLAQILPTVVSKGYAITVPMPGHPVATSDINKVSNDIKQLLELIRAHDVVFLGTDSRESRWLPTLLAAAEGKLLINAALGFDTYLVMRHGVSGGPQRLGCYFCNDVVAPGDSQRDRTLDQQCTVTRPGASMMAASLAVELFVAILHHRDGARAPAETNEESETGLGLLPHQIRGFMCTYKELLLNVEAYDKCTACSPVVLEQYHKRGLEFLFETFQNPMYLEDLTGLTKLKEEARAEPSFAVQEGDDF